MPLDESQIEKIKIESNLSDEETYWLKRLITDGNATPQKGWHCSAVGNWQDVSNWRYALDNLLEKLIKNDKPGYILTLILDLMRINERYERELEEIDYMLDVWINEEAVNRFTNVRISKIRIGTTIYASYQCPHCKAELGKGITEIKGKYSVKPKKPTPEKYPKIKTPPT